MCLKKRDRARLEKLKQQTTSQPTPEQREESFRRWLEAKRNQNERRRAEEIMRKYRNNERMEKERLKRERAKEEKLAEWIRKKEKEMKGSYITQLHFI